MITLAVLLFPLVGAIALAALPASQRDAARPLATVFSGVTLVLSLFLLPGLSGYDGVLDPRHEVDVAWIPAIDVRFHIGVDGVSVPLIVLTALLTFLCCVHQWVEPLDRPGAALAMVLLLEVGVIGTFVALDLVLFFISFEIVLIPMYFLIAQWGGEGRRPAAMKFVLYTLLGSAFVIVGILLVYAQIGTFDLVELSAAGGDGIGRTAQILAFAALAIGFAIKSPLWPLHTWLPAAHTEAPTVGSVLLAGVMLKMGTYGLIRVCLPVLPEGARAAAPTMAVLAVAGIVVGASCCLMQNEIKRLIAYSSVGHMGFVVLGIATLSSTGVAAALLGNIAHGLITGLLFFLAGAVKQRFHTGLLSELGSGLASRLPRLGAVLVFGAVASLGLPGLAGFWGEAFTVYAALNPAPGLPHALYVVCAVIALFGMLMTAAYFLRLLRLVVLGANRPGERLRSGDGLLAPDAPVIEAAVWAPLIVLTVVVGLYPRLVLGLANAPAALIAEVLAR